MGVWVLFLVVVGSVSTSYSTFILDIKNASVEDEFQRFIVKYNKSYKVGSNEYFKRLAVFEVRLSIKGVVIPPI
jgi:hypothetical protein